MSCFGEVDVEVFVVDYDIEERPQEVSLNWGN